MSENIVKGFNINGTVVKYDYNSLENKLELDNTLTVANAAADAKAAGDAIRAQNASLIFPTAKQALLDCFAHVAWADDQGQEYYDALEAALFPEAELESISAVYTQSGTVYDTDSLDSLKVDLVVTATYGDSSTQTVPAASYTLSGTLTVGTSTITVSYGGKTTTFDVTVTEHGVVENFDKVGTPLIVDGIYTPSADSWIVTKDEFDPDTDLWEFVFKINRTGTSGFQNLISSGAIFYQANGTSVAIRLKSEGSSSYDIAGGGQSFSIPANTPTWVKTGYYHNQSGYYYGVYTSTDGSAYTQQKVFNPKTNPINPSKITFGSKASNTNAVTAEYDLNECYIKVNGVTVWTPYS